MEIQSENINEIATALSKAQGELKPAKKTCKSHYADYADFRDVVDAARDALRVNGLAVSQLPFPGEDGKLLIVTTLMHSSGQWLRSYMPVIAHKWDNHTMGSGITYAKRYSFESIVGIVKEGEDDDGKEAVGDGSKPGKSISAAPFNKSKPKPQKKEQPLERISQIQVNQLETKINGHEDVRKKVVTWIKKAYGGGLLRDIPIRDFAKIMLSCEKAIVEKYTSNGMEVIHELIATK